MSHLYCQIVRRSNYVKSLMVIVGLLVFGSFQALAQEATVVGTVTDPSGAAVPNVSIIVTNTDTGEVKNSKQRRRTVCRSTSIHWALYGQGPSGKLQGSRNPGHRAGGRRSKAR